MRLTCNTFEYLKYIIYLQILSFVAIYCLYISIEFFQLVLIVIPIK